MTILRYVAHAEVSIEPELPVPRWGLSQQGRERVTAMLEQPWLATVGAVVSSAETKAMQTATILAKRVGLPLEIRPESGETDRSATGYVPHDRHERLAAEFFAKPAASAAGWERAIDAQLRVVEALDELLDDRSTDTIVVGHGGVGTLLYCHLTGQAISGDLAPSGQGFYWAFDRGNRQAIHHWRPIDAIEA